MILTKFICNVNKYLDHMSIKHTYLSTICSIEKSKLSRLLNGKQKENCSDMESIANALGKSVEFFLSDNIVIPQIEEYALERIAFYVGHPTKEQQEIANHLIEMMENIDVILSAKARFISVL